MSHQRIFTHDDILKLPIVFELDERRGGLIHRLKFTQQLQNALRVSDSLQHLSIPIHTVLNSDGSVCYAIISKSPVKHSYTHGLDVWKGGCLYGTMIGFCFLHFGHPTDRSIAQMGVVLIPECRNKGYGRAAVHKLLTYAFDALKVHRVFAHIVCPTASARSVEERKTSLFDTKRICHTFQTYGLQFEGVSRGAIMMEVNGGQNVWEDMHRLSILDIDWFSMQMGSLSTGDSVTWFVGPSTPWDAMEQRHERERKAILEWCDNSGSSKPAADVDEADDDEAYCCSDGSYEGSDE